MRKKGFVAVAMAVLCLVCVEVSRAGEVAKPRGSKTEKPEPATQRIETPTEKIIHRFKDAQEMQDFQRMYQMLQLINNRIAVLQDYLTQERANLEQLNAQMYVKLKFVLEPNKAYNLDTLNMTISEVNPPDCEKDSYR